MFGSIINSLLQRKADKHRAYKKHNITADKISSPAIRVIKKLQAHGHKAYLVGGGVRDLLAKQQPKDFDIVTDASPEKIRHLIRHSRIIGRRFRLVHVYFPGEIIEVATFRAEPKEGFIKAKTGMLLSDNAFGSIEQDVWRRDFTINALYYDLQRNEILDYVNGVKDMRRHIIRTIGDASIRYREDPVRMLRALRWVSKLDFSLDKKAEQALRQNYALIHHVAGARLFDEVIKLFYCGAGFKAFNLLRDYHFLEELYPPVLAALEEDKDGFYQRLIKLALDNTDRRLRERRSLNPAFIMAVLFWLPLQTMKNDFVGRSRRQRMAYALGIDRMLDAKQHVVPISKRFMLMMREIWELQPVLENYRSKRAQLSIRHPRFRAAYDFLLLRAEAGDLSLREAATWWQARTA